jgi:hypothetical protein
VEKHFKYRSKVLEHHPEQIPVWALAMSGGEENNPGGKMSNDVEKYKTNVI